jgi:uncharacterized protein YciW
MDTKVSTYDPANDLIDRLVGLTPGSKTYETRHHRAKVAAATQGSYDTLFAPALPGLSLAERLVVALYASRLTPSSTLIAHYREQAVAAGVDASLIQLAEQGEPSQAPSARLAAILAFTRKLIENPVEGDRDALLTLPQAGLSTPEVVVLSQLIAFLSYQVRLVAGLIAMKAQEESA